jgi:hypothetical protein
LLMTESEKRDGGSLSLSYNTKLKWAPRDNNTGSSSRPAGHSAPIRRRRKEEMAKVRGI